MEISPCYSYYHGELIGKEDLEWFDSERYAPECEL